MHSVALDLHCTSITQMFFDGNPFALRAAARNLGKGVIHEEDLPEAGVVEAREAVERRGSPGLGPVLTLRLLNLPPVFDSRPGRPAFAAWASPGFSFRYARKLRRKNAPVPSIGFEQANFGQANFGQAI
jgi:hypothetical protein